MYYVIWLWPCEIQAKDQLISVGVPSELDVHVSVTRGKRVCSVDVLRRFRAMWTRGQPDKVEAMRMNRVLPGC